MDEATRLIMKQIKNEWKMYERQPPSSISTKTKTRRKLRTKQKKPNETQDEKTQLQKIDKTQEQ